MKGPTDVLPEPAADATGAYRARAGRPRETGKALRRQELFLDQRGLTHDAPQLSPDEPGGTSLYLRGAQRREAMLAQAGGGPEWHPVGPAGRPPGPTHRTGPGPAGPGRPARRSGARSCFSTSAGSPTTPRS